ncbi:hypothetical protein AVEN_219655-1 [Araneus ventricosus]|uniref:DDE-1 domain-containing protein n=1 Tax=Araneus ventricosus TaxID=182803 RepID=A0A4Y2SAY3_ARAVE|nr:hypothetical protein AVEN_188620-1 [Araneus ventricosus]GBN85216.1 hypothetical protein AVEN_122338-1 [Araneus ventricosus]GBN85217.1 hypothetical protein AVEN_219655-1 [Araneus ventricosus]
MPAVIVVFEGESEFPLSLIEELGRSRILRSLYFNDLRNHRVNRNSVVTFFANFASVQRQIQILGSRYLSMDETVVTTVLKPRKIIARNITKEIGSVTSVKRGTLVTIAFAAGANGDSFPTFLL